jgi:palmitoyltransferase ZDHHC6
MGKKLQRLVVGLTVSLIAFISYSSQISIIWPWYGREVSVDLLFLLGPFKLAPIVYAVKVGTWIDDPK